MNWWRNQAPAVVIVLCLVLIFALVSACSTGTGYYNPPVIVHHTVTHVHVYVHHYYSRRR